MVVRFSNGTYWVGKAEEGLYVHESLCPGDWIEMKLEDGDMGSIGETAPHAICLAALKATGIKTP